MNSRLVELEQAWSKRINEARKEGREAERLYIDNVLTATMLDAMNPDQRAALKLARDLVRGLPKE